MLFQGSMVALVTPFKNGKVDEKALRALVDWQIQSGTDALVPCGTTGESPTLTDEEQEKIVSIVVEQSAKRVPVLAGAGSNCTEKAIKLTRQAKKAGADGTLQVTPYYNKPTQEGLYQHFKAIASACDLPVVLYNVPGRTAVSLNAETVLRLSEIDNIVGIKEGTINAILARLEQIDKIIKEAGPHFGVYSGDDSLNVQIYTLGGKGAISVTANIAPQRVASIWSAFAKGNRRQAIQEHENLEPLNNILFIESNPIPVKTALAWMGKIGEEFRLPLCPMSAGNKAKLKEILQKEKLIA